MADMRHSNIVSEASLRTRANLWWAGVPFITACLVGLCSAVYVVDLLVGYDSFEHICLLPVLIVTKFQVYRVFSSVIFHASILHLVFNMLAFVPIGGALERVLGSIKYLHALFLLAISNGALHTGLAFLTAHNPVFAYPQIYKSECGIGFSGIIFSLIVIETSLSASQTRSIFGFFTVPSKWYPWALLAVFQLLVPNVSLLGHLSGILSGFAYSYGVFNFFLLNPSTYYSIEGSPILSLLVQRPGFVVGGTGFSTLPTLSNMSGVSGLRNAWSGLQSIFPRREVPPDERFPGRGRVLGSAAGGIGPNRAGSLSNPEIRHSNNSSPADLQIRLLDRNLLNASDLQQGRASPPTARTGAAVGETNPEQTGFQVHSQEQGIGSGIDNASLQSLVAMGFDKGKAMHALLAANGDVTLAVEFLSAE